MQGNAGLLASFGFFIYCAALAFALEPRGRNRVLLGAAVGLLLSAWWATSADTWILHDWVLPPVVLLCAYWTSGALFTEPSTRAERRLSGIDRVLRIRELAARAPRVVAELLELSYVWVYPVIPVALAIHVLATRHPDVNRFWSVILITDYVCFAMLPWIQTRPPRALEPASPWRSSIRRFNLKLLGETSIGVNTFPSGHAAEALAAALLVLGAPPGLEVWMFASAAAISAGAVFGRYHYAADAIAGWIVALAVWALL
ncbi:MAG: phosphatase PAP2 family protein [Acidobacteriota bacterium]